MGLPASLSRGFSGDGGQARGLQGFLWMICLATALGTSLAAADGWDQILNDGNKNCSVEEYHELHPTADNAYYERASNERHPYRVSVRDKTEMRSHRCAGVLIRPHYVLTAAHCMDEVGPNPVIHVGAQEAEDNEDSPGVMVVGVADIVVPPCWNGDVFEGCDIALARLEEAVKHWASPRLPHEETDDGAEKRPVAAVIGLGAGGSSGPRDLKNSIRFLMVSHDRCPCDMAEKMKDGMICGASYGQKIRDGDSGSPLLLADAVPRANRALPPGNPRVDEIIGILSFANSCEDSGRTVCGVGFTRVKAHLAWIHEQLNLPEGQIPSEVVNGVAYWGLLILGAMWAAEGFLDFTHRWRAGKLFNQGSNACMPSKGDWEDATLPSEDELDTADLQQEKTKEIVEQHKYQGGEKKFEGIVEKLKAELKSMPQVDHGTVRDTKGSAAGKVGKKGTKEEEMLKAKAVDVAYCLDLWGSRLRNQGQYQGAAEKHKEALKIRKQYLEIDHRSLPSTYGKLAEALRLDGKLPDAAECYRTMIRIKGKVLGEKHRDCAEYGKLLGAVLEEDGLLEEAEKAYDESLAVCGNVQQCQHGNDLLRQSAILMCDLARVCRKQAEAPEATDELRKDRRAKCIRLFRQANRIRYRVAPLSWCKRQIWVFFGAFTRVKVHWIISFLKIGFHIMTGISPVG